MDHYKNVPLCSMWIVPERMFSPKTTKPISNYLGRIRVRVTINDLLTIRCLDLFAEGNDFSWETIEKNRNRFYQQQQANQISSETDETIDLLTNALHIHLNLEQNLTFETPNAFMSLGTVSIESLSNRILSPVANAPIRLPEQFTSSLNNQSTISFRVCLLPSVDFEYLRSTLVFDPTVGIIGPFGKLYREHESLAIRVLLSLQRGESSVGANERDRSH